MEVTSALLDLEEFCRKRKCAPLIFSDFKVEGSGYNSKVKLLVMEAHGNEASKFDANTCETNPYRDMFKELRNYCERHNMLHIPIIDIVEQSLRPDPPKFVARCILGPIKRYGISDTKKDARQRAATAVWNLVSNGYYTEV